MSWSFLLPGVPLALLGLWHAAPSRDETVLLASSQRPADCSHVSACLSVNNCRPLAAFTLTAFFSHSFLRHLLVVSHSDWQFRPFRLHFANARFPASMNVFFIFFSWLTSVFSAFDFSLPQRPWSQDDCDWGETLHYPCLMNERQQINAHQSFIISPWEISPTKHPTSTPLSEPNLKSLLLHNSHHSTLAQLCLQKMIK